MLRSEVLMNFSKYPITRENIGWAWFSIRTSTIRMVEVERWVEVPSSEERLASMAMDKGIRYAR